MMFFTLAGSFALFPPAVMRIFGPHAGTVIYGLVYSAFACASLTGGVLTKLLARSFGWERVFQALAGLSLVATAMVAVLRPIVGYDGSVV